jgi:glycosyltransferase involved in cell wall biosynthesis
MPRVLHLHPHVCDFQTSRCLEMLANNLRGKFEMASQSLGPGGDLRNLPEAIVRLRYDPRRQTHIAHAWGAAELVAAAAGGFERIIFSPQGMIPPRWRRWVDRVLRRGTIKVICPTRWARDAFVSRGAPAGRCRVIAPAIDSARMNGVDRSLRERLGIGDSEIALLAPGESVREAGHGSSTWTAAMLNVLDPKWRLLAWGRGPMVESLRRFGRVNDLANLVVVAEERLGVAIDFERLAPAADAAVVFSEPSAPVLPVAVCMAAGVPIIASETAELREFLSDNTTAVLDADSNPRRVAQRMLKLIADEKLRSVISQNAKKEAAERFSVERFIGGWRDVYGEAG